MGSYPWASAFWTDARETVAPPRSAKDGLLPPLLVALTAVTGLVDAFSYLVLGHVFVANMTGNVVFFAFALAGVHGFSATASVAAIGCFAVGALAVGRIGRSLASRRELLLGVTAGIQAVIVAEAVTMTALTSSPMPVGLRYALIVSLSLTMGAQNATARKLAVPDLTTTVLTLTITGVAADGPLAGATGARVARRLISVAAMFLGALVGALLVLRVHIVYPLVIALVILVVVAITARSGLQEPPNSPAPGSVGGPMRLAALSSDTMTPEQVGLYREILSGPRGQGPRAVLLDTGAGGLAGPFNAMLYAPEVGRALQELGAAIRFRTQLTPRVREMAILVVAQVWNSDYERSSHEPIGHDAGLTDPEIKALRAGADPGFTDDQERVAYQVVRSLTGPADLDDQQYDQAVATLGEQSLVELSTLVGYYATLALQLRIFRVDPE